MNMANLKFCTYKAEGLDTQLFGMVISLWPILQCLFSALFILEQALFCVDHYGANFLCDLPIYNQTFCNLDL